MLDYNVVGGALRPYRRMVLDRKRANGEIVVEYGSANAIEESNVQPVGWCLDAWSLGADGVLPWQTIGNGRFVEEGRPARPVLSRPRAASAGRSRRSG